MSSSSLARHGTSRWRPSRFSAGRGLRQQPCAGRKLQAKIATLRNGPERRPVDPDSDVYGEEVRVLLHGKRGGVYRVLFTIRHQTVHVLTVRHSAQRSLADEMAEDDSDEGGEPVH